MRAPWVELASDLSVNLPADERYRRVLSATRQMIPCDAVTLLRLHDGALVPLAVDGLRPEASARRYAPSDHPRLARIVGSTGPVRFDDPTTPDPFDGLFAGGETGSRAHACAGCPVNVDGELVGALTIDACSPSAFDAVAPETIAMIGALAGAAIHTTTLSSALAETGPRSLPAARRAIRQALDGVIRELHGASPAMVRVHHEIELLARTDLTALVTGETGVGKELVAHQIHARSGRAGKPMVHVNCAALPEALAESELFGHIRGAFTGAVDHRAGKFEIADGGSLFLDEIGELPLSIQPKLLRVLQSGEVQRIGSDRSLRVDVRVIAATNRDLWDEVRAGRFRADLFHRLAVYPLHVPALRARRDDIPVLTARLLERARADLGVGPILLSTEASERLHAYDWPGNIRELEHALMRGALCASNRRPQQGGADEPIVVAPADLGLDAAAPSAPTRSAEMGPARLRDAVDDFTRTLVTTTVAACGGNWAEAARRLGLQRGNLHRLANRLGLRERN